MTPTVRPATREDLEAFYSEWKHCMPTTKAWAAELDDEIIAMGGMSLHQGRWYAFLDLTEKARPYKMTLMRTAKRTMDEARRMGVQDDADAHGKENDGRSAAHGRPLSLLSRR